MSKSQQCFIFFLLFALIYFSVPAKVALAEVLPIPTAEADPGMGGGNSTEDGCCKIISVRKRCQKVTRNGRDRLECTAPYSKNGDSIPAPDSCGDGTRTTTPNEIVDHCPTNNPKPVGSCGDGKHEAGDICTVNRTVIFFPDQWCIPSQNSYPSCGSRSEPTPEQQIESDGGF